MIPQGELLADRFVVGHELGQGGLAWVASAWDRRERVEVALKILLPQHASQRIIRQRFRREVLLSQGLVHSGIVEVYDLHRDDRWLFFSMELCQGLNLKEWTRVNGRPSRSQRRELLRDLAGALRYAHKKGVIHRDIKPQNVMWSPGRGTKLLDFGLARVESMAGLTSHSTLLGTPDYMAPELAAGLPVDGRSDIYSLGVLWYELATGKMPFTASSPFELLRTMADNDGPAPTGNDVDEVEAHLVQRLLKRRPEERINSIEELLDAMDGAGHLPDTEQNPAFCLRCGTQASQSAPFCLACGADWGGTALSRGSAMLALTHSDGSTEDLDKIMESIGTAPNPTEDPRRALSRLPVVLLKGIEIQAAKGLRAALLQGGFTTELRLLAEDNFDLLHRRGTPGILFTGALLGSWAVICTVAYALTGTLGLCLALAAGPAVGWLLQKRSHIFLAPVYLCQTQAESRFTAIASSEWRDFLQRSPEPATLRLAEGLMVRTHLLAGELERISVPREIMAGIRRAIQDSVSAGMEILHQIMPLDVSLRVTDLRALWEELEAAETRAKMASSPEMARLEKARVARMEAELTQMANTEEERSRLVQRLLRLTSSIDRSRRDLRSTTNAADQASIASKRLHDEAGLLRQAVTELDQLSGGMK